MTHPDTYGNINHKYDGHTNENPYLYRHILNIITPDIDFNLVTSIISLYSLKDYTFSDITIRLIIAQFDFYVYKIRQAFSTFSHRQK